jgi:hypothetical protein
MPSNREIATLIILAALVALGLISSAMRKAMIDVLKACFVRRILILIAIYLSYILVLTLVAWKVDLWRQPLLKDSIVITLTVGLPMILGAVSAKDGTLLVKNTFLKVLGVSAFVTSYVNLASLSIAGELAMQVCVMVLVILSIAAKHRGGQSLATARIIDRILILMGLALLFFTTVHLIQTHDQFKFPIFWRTAAMSVWMPLTLLPLIYIIAFYARYEVLITTLKLRNDLRNPSPKTRLALLLGLRGSVRSANRFMGVWLTRIASPTSFRESLRVMKEFRFVMRVHEKREKLAAAKKRAEEKRLRQMTGVEGIDEFGRQLDQREFLGTMRLLNDLAAIERAQYRTRLDQYSEDLIVNVWNGEDFGLPRDHGTVIEVSDDQQSWYAWRRTATGWILGIGSTSEIDRQWFFSSDSPPAGFPPSEAAGWTETPSRGAAPDWMSSEEG